MKPSFRFLLGTILSFALLVVAASLVQAQFGGAASASSAFSIPTAQLMQPEELVRRLHTGAAARPLILQVGSHMMFAQAHIPGSEYVGPGSQTAGLEQLKARVARMDRKTEIVLYCGCCPWNRCPNVGPAYKTLVDLGFTHARVLYLANNFGADWAEKGYPVEAGQ